MRTKILIVEDQFIEANNLKLILKEAGYAVLSLAGSVSQALEIMRHQQPDLALLDIYLDGEQTGIDLATILHSREIPFVYLSANADKATLEKAKATTPYGFLVKPCRRKDVLVMLEIALYLHAQRAAIVRPMSTVYEEPKAMTLPLVGESEAIREVLKNIRIVGPSDISALILGENGTGKELVAEGIHRLSTRKDKPLVTVNCAVLPTELIESELFGHEKGAFTGAQDRRIGKFEQADGGTIFLDEIGELPPNLQAKFLRVLQSKEIEPLGGKSKKVNVRVIAATNRNLEDEIAAGRFRMDLYYRLNIFSLKIPPLRQRKEDIPLLARHFLEKYCRQEGRTIGGFSEPVMRAMMNHFWPGNIRELENFVARSVLIAEGPLIEKSDLPVAAGLGNGLPGNGLPGSAYTGSTPSGNGHGTDSPATAKGVKSIAEQERDHIVYVLNSCNWKLNGRGGAAELLQINASTLRSRMKKLGIMRPDY